MSTKKADARTETKAPRWSLAVRIALSVILGVHLLAVFLPPFTFATTGSGGPSPFAEPLMRGLRPYIDLAYLNHGYFFFAPNPGPSHLLRARLQFDDGRPEIALTIPDHHQQRPRLFYHRHFMLAEQFHADSVPPQPPPELVQDVEEMSRWRQSRAMYERRRAAFVAHLKTTHGASDVTLKRVEHVLPTPAEFQAANKPLNAADTYRDLPEDAPPRPPFGLPSETQP